MSQLREWVRSIIVILFIFFVSTEFIVQAFKDGGNSMTALLTDCELNGHYLVVKFMYLFDGPKRGDLVLFRGGPYNQVLISRIVGLPGERLTIEKGQVFVDGRRMSEESVITQAAFNLTTVVATESYFVLPDRRSGPLSASAGSQIWGSIPRAAILGRLWFTYWPVRAFGPLRRPQYSF